MEAKVENFSEAMQKTALAAKLLGHPARVAIIVHLATAETCLTGDISSILPLSRTTAMQHLRALKEAGWVKGAIQGARINYCLDTHKIKADTEALTQFLRLRDTLEANNC